MEEVLLSIFGRDEAEPAVGDQLLDGPCRHLKNPPSRKSVDERTALSRRSDRGEHPPTNRGTDLPYHPAIPPAARLQRGSRRRRTASAQRSYARASATRPRPRRPRSRSREPARQRPVAQGSEPTERGSNRPT